MAVIGFAAIFLLLTYFLVVSIGITYLTIAFQSKACIVSLLGVFVVLFLFYKLFQYAPFTVSLL